MAKLDKNHPLAGVRGRIGNLVFKVRKGQPYVASAPCSNNKRAEISAPQRAVLTRFREMTARVKQLLQDPAIKSQYQSAAKAPQSAYTLAMADAAKAPEVLSIEAKKNRSGVRRMITVMARDNFKVMAVKIAIHNSAGKLIEEGDALPCPEAIEWKYKTIHHNEIITGCRITATATDLAGNEAKMEIVLSNVIELNQTSNPHIVRV